MKSIHAVMAVAMTGIALSGCATVLKGSSQQIVVDTPPVTGATCVLSSDQGSWMVTSPGMVRVERSKEDMQIRCNKPGYQEAVSIIPSNFEGWTIGNILVGGLVGVGVDAATGAINQYPHAFQVPMQPAAPGQPTPARPAPVPQSPTS